jgi:hypothetical protein
LSKNNENNSKVFMRNDLARNNIAAYQKVVIFAVSAR